MKNKTCIDLSSGAKFYATTIIVFYIFILGFSADAAVVGSTDDSMTIGGGARPIGMGRAFTGVVDDADAMFINPAGSAGLKGPQAMAMFTNLVGDVYYSELCAAIPGPYGTFGLGYITTGVNGIPTTPVPSDYYDSMLVFSYSAPLARWFNYWRNVYVGLNYKLFNRGYTGGLSQYATGMSADIGAKIILSPNLSFGISRQNFLPVSMGGVIRLSGGAEESLASLIKVGIAAKPIPLPKLLIALDSDIPQQTGRPLTSHIGIEWNENEYFAVRAGLDQSINATTPAQASWNPAYGISLNYRGLRVDYAYHAYYNDPGLATSYISLSYIGAPVFALKGKAD